MDDFERLSRPEPAYRVAIRESRFADRVLGTIVAGLLFAMVALTTVDVVGRYLFNSPLQGSYEITQLLMLALVFAALPSVTRRSEHISVGLFEDAFRGRARTLRDIAVALVVTIASAYLAWRLYILADRFHSFGDTMASRDIPIAPIAYAGAAAMALCAVASLQLMVEAMRPPHTDESK